MAKELKFRRFSSRTKVPVKMSKSAAGYDLYSSQNRLVKGFSCKLNQIKFLEKLELPKAVEAEKLKKLKEVRMVLVQQENIFF